MARHTAGTARRAATLKLRNRYTAACVALAEAINEELLAWDVWREHLYRDPRKPVKSEADQAAQRAAHPEYAEWEAERERLEAVGESKRKPFGAALKNFRAAHAALKREKGAKP